MSSKIIAVTGASKGIGAEIARQLADAGYAVVIIGRSAERLNSVAEYIQAEGGAVFPLLCDITNEEDIGRAREFIKQLDGQFKAIIHSAGIVYVGKLSRMKPKEWREQIEINLTAPFLLSQKLIPELKEGGQVIFINSAAGKQVFPEWGGYAVSKFGLKALADTLREEHTAEGIRVTTIFPASVNTTFHNDLPFNWDRTKMLRAGDVAGAVLYCLKQPSTVRINEIVLENAAGKF
ncbi:MAG: SDR family NAD(P)-dependent oxidoreductase [Calditrichaceae bacterium]|nr:SDR family NAD(P)-dependent oxidoreductase [Calditrichaceae bacterium]MBN2707976.1 SDR family NAD(P)-dependent oxidoreductase [Calditrichaceae bacterium]RQV95923.1 MAG: SDR family NAD(P)-dependent oxidoreductase [Calditrichota bacterium]